MEERKSIGDFCYDSLSDWTMFLLDVIIGLPNGKEIMESPEYIRLYNKYSDDFGKYLVQEMGECLK